MQALPTPAAIACTLALCPSLLLAQGKDFTLEQTAGRGERINLSGELERWAWAPDGVHLVRGRGDDARLVDPRTMEEKAPEPKEEGEAGEAGEARSPRRRPSGGGERRELADPSPDGTWLAFIEDNDLHVIEQASERRRALTSGGGPETFNGKLDWVYQEEIYGRGRFKAFWWSPDSTRIAYLRLDESAVHEFTVVDHIEKGHFRVKPEITNYPKVGDPNPSVRLGVVKPADGSVSWIDLSKYEGTEPLVIRVGWNPDGSKVVFEVQDRIQTWLDLNLGDPETGEMTTLIHEESDSWVNRLSPPRWLADGSFLWHSERTGYEHIYHYAADGTLIRPVTSGDWTLGSIQHLDEVAGKLWFTGTEGGAVNSNLYRVGLDGSGFARLTTGEGRHRVTFNADRSMFLDQVSSLASPPEVRLCDADGKVMKVVAETDLSGLADFRLGAWALHGVPARDGFELDVSVLTPPDFDPAGSYAVWIPTYSGPNAPSVRNSWNTSVMNQFLAQQGVIVMQVNVRSASGKGQWSTAQAYKQMGTVELRDLEDAVDWICANPWADASRVGITGYSYGGFMSAFALCKSKKFALGIAGGGVYDWRMYDTIYTERYMSTPEANEEGYGSTSVVAAAGDLTGHLVLHHGTMDDNVHMQNLMHMVQALQKADKSFEMMVYPQNRHGVRDSAQRWHLRRLEWDAVREHLLGGGSGTPVEASATVGTD